MKTVCFNPYASYPSDDSSIASFVSLLAAYLHSHKIDIINLICDGCIESCKLDYIAPTESRHCQNCLKEQENLARWLGASPFYLSAFTKAKNLVELKKNIFKQDYLKEALGNTSFNSVNEYIQKSNFQSFKNQIFSTAVTFKFALINFITESKAKCLLSYNQSDLLHQICIDTFLEKGLLVAEYQRAESNKIKVKSNKQDDYLTFDFAAIDFTAIRRDPNTWDDFLHEIIIENMTYLGLSSSQLSLNI